MLADPDAECGQLSAGLVTLKFRFQRNIGPTQPQPLAIW